jgi:hypothetical protein
MYQLCHSSVNFIDIIQQTGMIDFQKHYLNLSGGIAGTRGKPDIPNLFWMNVVRPIYFIYRSPDF